MPKYAIIHAEKEPGENTEVVGSNDLRKVFADKGVLRGSFSINGHEYRNVEARNGDGLIATINNNTASSGVTASLDNEGHLVLENNSDQPIAIRKGAPFEAAPGPMSDNVADQVVTKLRAEKRDGDQEQPKNTILEDLGLSETEQDEKGNDAPMAGFTLGASKEERDERRKAAKEGRQVGYSSDNGTAGAGKAQHASDVASAPTTGPSLSPGRMPDGRGRTGQGDGLTAKPDGTPAVPGSPANPGPGGGDNASTAPFSEPA